MYSQGTGFVVTLIDVLISEDIIVNNVNAKMMLCDEFERERGRLGMIRLYTQSSCHSSRVARQWLETHGIKFKEKNFSVDSPTVQDLKRILSLTEHGVDDIISARSKDYPKIAPKLPEMPLNEALKLLCENPKLLRRPIIISDSKIQIGFNEDDIRQFIPRPVRRLKFNAMLNRLDGNEDGSVTSKRMVE